MVHKWIVNDMHRQISDNLVYHIDFRVESEREGFTARYVGEVSLTGSIDNPDFIPYEDLTEETVIEWVKSQVDVSNIEENAANIISDKIGESFQKPPTIINGYPWE